MNDPEVNHADRHDTRAQVRKRPALGGSPELQRLLSGAAPPEAYGGSAPARVVLAWLAREVPQMVIIAETHCQRARIRELPALDLYDGSCFSQLRARVGTNLPYRRRVFVLTTRYGLVGADERLRPYEPKRLGPDGLKHATRRALHAYLAVCPVEEMLLLLPTAYLDLLPRVTGRVGQVHTIADSARGWPEAAAHLDRWGWP
ncbi:hypothetical protein LO772_08230 [Yinghuangia sp. ASG 101]|uniref:hypothetical protein n=1 Tax=Yinghuangia sp. ASG 101 TaxID=2896848 RepID=UPI001E32D4A7|nr:hypothetical protein [Yinghuangia sp. ASG 101]UGQ13580.1 hypothetical protein LO772_08230 [Yinghuangia sp. ASG 101]